MTILSSFSVGTILVPSPGQGRAMSNRWVGSHTYTSLHWQYQLRRQESRIFPPGLVSLESSSQGVISLDFYLSFPQDIFECRTCNLTGTLCCCMECAYTCHRGHDCGFKRSSPKAYCDCWQGSKCHALATGGTYERKSLLSKLLGMTELGVQVNSRQQHLLGVLAATVVRQQKEQNNYTGSSAYRSSRSHVSENIPVYDLPPPKFAQKALAMVLENWACVRAQIMCDAQGIEEGAWPGLGSKGHASVVSLDSFVYLILTKLSLKVGMEFVVLYLSTSSSRS